MASTVERCTHVVVAPRSDPGHGHQGFAPSVADPTVGPRDRLEVTALVDQEDLIEQAPPRVEGIDETNAPWSRDSFAFVELETLGQVCLCWGRLRSWTYWCSRIRSRSGVVYLANGRKGRGSRLCCSSIGRRSPRPARSVVGANNQHGRNIIKRISLVGLVSDGRWFVPHSGVLAHNVVA